MALVIPVWENRNEPIVVSTSTKLLVKAKPLVKTFVCASISVNTTSLDVPGTPPSQLVAADQALLTPKAPLAPFQICAACRTRKMLFVTVTPFVSDPLALRLNV